MKKTKTSAKKTIIILAIIVVIGLCLLIFKKNPSHEDRYIETTTGNDTEGMYQGELTFEITGPEEEPKNEERVHAPAEIKNIVQAAGITMLTLDMLTMNKDFKPGVNDFFINQNPKLRDIAIDKDAKAFNCGAGADNDETTADISIPVQTVIDAMQQRLTGNNGRLTYYFDISDNKIHAIYQQCLP